MTNKIWYEMVDMKYGETYLSKYIGLQRNFKKMVIISNRIKGTEVLIDDSHHSVIFMPQDYDVEFPNIKIELKGIDFERHSHICKDCKSLVDDFGTDSVDWFITWNKKTFRLDLSNLGVGRDKTLVSWTVGHYFTGTKLKLMISTETIEKLSKELQDSIILENYEHCAFLRDRIEKLNGVS